MIALNGAAVAMPGKSLEFVAFAKEMAEIVNHVAGGAATVGVSFGAAARAVAGISHADRLARMEETMAKLAADGSDREALEKAEHLAVPGMSRDRVWRRI